MRSILTALVLAGFMLATAPSLAAKPAADQATAAKAPPKVFTSVQKEGTRATCPVTGEAFTIGKDTVHVEHKGKHVYFCCPGCKAAFDKDPDKYTSGR
jgi:xanthine dehydrogenase accessory factor